MKSPSPPHSLARRDWLKAAGLGGAAALLAGTQSTAETPATAPKKKVRGVVFMVSDGMSPGVLTLAEDFSKLTRQRGTRWWQLMNERSSTNGLMENASANSMVTDSAAAATAWGSGQRVNNGAINTDPSGKSLTPIGQILKESVSAKIGLVTTATVTHATPAGFVASVPQRDDEQEIAKQYLNRADVILGGGLEFFSPKLRSDGKDLIGNFEKAGYEWVNNREKLLAARGEKLLGIFTQKHLPFALDHSRDPELAANVPTLEEMTKAALARFLEGDQPFLLQVEGARIDHAAHLNDIAALLGDQLAFDDAVSAALAMTAGRDDILVVVTSDHGNANPGLNGEGDDYAQSTQSFQRIARITASHERIFTEWKKSVSQGQAELSALLTKHFQITFSANEMAALHDLLNEREVVQWSHQLRNPVGLLGQIVGNHTGIGWTGTTHTTDPTLVTATGPESNRFTGIFKNSDVFGHLMEILG